MAGDYVVYGAAGSGSMPVEAALTLAGQRYSVIEKVVWADPAAAEEMAKVNPLRQVPALVLPSGELMTESAAILIWLAEAHPEARLAPPPGSPDRAAFLRWMAYVSAQVYAFYWIRDDLSRLAADKAHEAVIDERTKARITESWRQFEAQARPRGPFMFGEDLTVLDLYIAVCSRWRPNRRAFYAVAPRLGEVARRVDAEPRLAAFWAERMPFEEGWEGAAP